jgi:hypothetical protein
VTPCQQVTEAHEDGRPATVFCSINFGFTTNSRTSRRRKSGDSAALLSPARPDTTFYRSAILLLKKVKDPEFLFTLVILNSYTVNVYREKLINL